MAMARFCTYKTSTVPLLTANAWEARVILIQLRFALISETMSFAEDEPCETNVEEKVSPLQKA